MIHSIDSLIGTHGGQKMLRLAWILRERGKGAVSRYCKSVSASEDAL